jgi:hypothetical protein
MAEKAPEITIGTVRSRTEITPEGKFQETYEIEYFIGDARHKVTMPRSQYSPKAAEEAVKKAAADILALQGKKVTLGQ